MNETVFVFIAAIRVLMYQFLAISLLSSAVIYRQWGRSTVFYIHVMAAVLFSLVGLLAFLDVSRIIVLSSIVRTFIVSPVLILLTSLTWYWQIARDREKINKAIDRVNGVNRIIGD